MRFQCSAARNKQFEEVSAGEIKSSPSTKKTIEEAARRSGLKFYAVITKWDALPVLPSDDMPIGPFIDAYRQILLVLDAFGAAFSIIKQDLKLQMARVREQCTRYGVDTLQKMVDRDGKTGKGTVALIWLKRTLQFTDVMLAKMLMGRPLPDAVDYAYHQTLIHAHPYVVRAVAKNIRYATPDTETFLKRIYKQDPQLVAVGIGEFLVSLRPRLAALVRFYNIRNYEDFQPLQALPAGTC
eukprot:Plantae.Rhodophyta-Purpureofilum_apyrenoidigerum.ctg3923.p1 GENE.Plantae.Rhodophyta-Purpureofilum_apyrenoidigerum.ctg3923~~Plantae.Rhodophyta-Purpureofilum_apyrenoidigerum.ctg3923.p1  ORF type:complete len:240 (-),score=25.41 Plantae.Rhodophyta-Purpureofilum_apyrenoidigerum.ctg3923:261-980(-)